MSNLRFVCLAVLCAASGCASVPPQSPPQYAEDYAGAALPYDGFIQAADGQIFVQLEPGHCRRIETTSTTPPRVVGEYTCRHPTMNVGVAVSIPNVGVWNSATGETGGVLFLIGDETALSFSPDAVATVSVANQPVGSVQLQPYLLAALSRVPRPVEIPTPSGPAPDRTAPVTQAERQDPPAPSRARTRPWTQWELLGLSSVFCALKEWTVGQCQEAATAKFGLEIAAAVCSAAEQMLMDDKVDLKKSLDEVSKARAAARSSAASVVSTLESLGGCLVEIHPKVLQASSRLPPLPL